MLLMLLLVRGVGNKILGDPGTCPLRIICTASIPAIARQAAIRKSREIVFYLISRPARRVSSGNPPERGCLLGPDVAPALSDARIH